MDAGHGSCGLFVRSHEDEASSSSDAVKLREEDRVLHCPVWSEHGAEVGPA